jgi:two-component system KDP operon response regulator KdpE
MRILVIDDEAEIRRVLRVLLEEKGYQTIEAASGADGLVMTFTQNPDCIVLDFGLPDLSGMDVLHSIRRQSHVPVVVLTIHDQEHEKIEALDSGADDYVTKPFSARELLARIRAAVRYRGQDRASPVLQWGALQVDFERRIVTRHGDVVRLTPTEYALFQALASRCGRVVTHQQLLDQVWGEMPESNPQYLRIYVGHVRKKIEEDPTNPQVILTEPGIGYRMVDPEDP